MRSGLRVCRHLVRWICCSAVILSAPTAWTQGQSDPLPWEIWSDLGEIARLRLDHRVVMRSSRCPDGCAYDRHSDGDERFIRRFGDEGVIFELEGAGAITRIWMTQGESAISHPLDENIRRRLTLDGAVDPRFPIRSSSPNHGGSSGQVTRPGPAISSSMESATPPTSPKQSAPRTAVRKPTSSRSPFSRRLTDLRSHLQ